MYAMFWTPGQTDAGWIRPRQSEREYIERDAEDESGNQEVWGKRRRLMDVVKEDMRLVCVREVNDRVRRRQLIG